MIGSGLENEKILQVFNSKESNSSNYSFSTFLIGRISNENVVKNGRKTGPRAF